MTESLIIVKSADRTFTRKINTIPGIDIDISATGLFLADDSSDPTSSTLGAQTDLVDGDLQNVISGTLTGSYSIGLDLGSSKTIQKLSIYDIIDGNFSGINQDGTNDTFEVYSSADNSTWVLVETFKPLNRVVFLDESDNPSPIPSPIPSPRPFEIITDSVYIIELIFETKPTARYFKAFASRGSVEDIGEQTLQISEIQALTQDDLSLDINITKNLLTVPSIVSDAPIAAPGDGTGGGEPVIT